MFAVRLAGLALLIAATASAHVGSPDVFLESSAGPYPVLVSIRPPDVIPGVAHVEVRALGDGVRRVQITPTPVTGPGAEHPPAPDEANRSPLDPKFFEGSLWLMTPGSWEVRLHVSGDLGEAELPVPVSAIALRTRPMDRGTEYFLIGMLLFLGTGLIAIVGASVRDAKLEPGAKAPSNRGSIFWMAGTATVLLVTLWAGWRWWGSDADTYSQKIYKPLVASATLARGSELELRLQDPGWLALRKLDDIIPDHGHAMHLFLIRWPAMDYMFHLHPEQSAAGLFTGPLPSLPAGQYRIFADIVHDSGLAETAAGAVTLPAVEGAPLAGDDAGGRVEPPPASVAWNNRPRAIRAREPVMFSFSLVDAQGKPFHDLEPYMGMGGHAEFIREDGQVFAHVHPSGSVPMASMAVASRAAMLAMHNTAIGSSVSFPYGVPSPGSYHVFVQLKRAGKVETGAFRFTVG